MLAVTTTDRSRITVAIALPLSPAQMQAVQAALGSAFAVEDIRRAPRESAIVVVPPCSAGTIRAVRRDFPAARVVVIEANTGENAGPIGRALASGAAVYAGATGPAGLADSVRWAHQGLAA